MASIAILHYTAPPVMGGVETVIEAHARELVKVGHDVTIIAGRGGTGEVFGTDVGVKCILVPEMDTLNNDVKYVTGILETGEIPLNFDVLKTSLQNRLTSILADFDVIFVHNLLTKHFNLPLTEAIYNLLDLGIIKKLINWCHDTTWGSKRRETREKVYDAYPWNLLRVFRKDIIYVTGSFQRKGELVNVYDNPINMVNVNNQQDIASRIKVIFNGLNAARLLGLRPDTERLIYRMGIMESDIVMLMPTRISDAKNIGYAVNLVAFMKKVGHNKIKLVVTGPPDPHGQDEIEYHNLLELRSELRLEDSVCFVYESGPDSKVPCLIDYETVGELLRVSDLMIMTSKREGFGVPVIEAALVGVPIVCSSNVPAGLEIAKENALIFDLNEEPASLAEKIIHSITNDPIYKLKKVARQKYTWSAIVENDIQPLL